MAATKATRVRVNFAGIEFSGFTRGDSRYVTVPTNIIRKLVEQKAIVAFCIHDYTDDYVVDNARNFGRGEVALERVIECLEMGKPWLSSLDMQKKEISFAPYPNYSMRLRPAKAENIDQK